MTTPTSPPPRFVHAISGEAGGRILLFGGFSSASNWLGDTWTYDWQNWQPRAPAHSPPSRSGHGLAFDLVRNRAVLFGGNGGSATFNDTWEWDGVDWIAVPTANAPSPRTWVTLTFDLTRTRTILFGGGGNADTWTWDGTVWTNVATATTPPARSCPALACDLARGNVVMFGGRSSSAGDLGDTWTFDGTNWTQQQPAHAPPSRQFSSMVFDQGRGRAVLFGGTSANADIADTWEWDGVDWQQRLPTGSSPSARHAEACMFDPSHNLVLLFGGGLGTSGSVVYADTWTYGADPAPLVNPFGAGCGGSNGTPQLTGSAASVGTALSVQLSGLSNSPFAGLVVGTSRTVWGTTPLPFDLAPYGMPGCRLLASANVSLVLPASNASAALSTPVPANPALAGMLLYVQGISFDPAANAGGAAFSNGLEVRIGGG